MLVVGGAGYIGSHMVKMLRQAGCHPVVVDDLSSGRRAAAGDSELLVGDIRDQAFVAGVLSSGRPDAVMHFARFIQAGASCADPAKHYLTNLSSTTVLLKGRTLYP